MNMNESMSNDGKKNLIHAFKCWVNIYDAWNFYYIHFWALLAQRTFCEWHDKYFHKNSKRIQKENKWMKIGDNIFWCVYLGSYWRKSTSKYSITWIIIVHTVYPDCMHHTLQPILVMVHYAANVLEVIF